METTASINVNEQYRQQLDDYIAGISEIARKVGLEITTLDQQRKAIEEMQSRMEELSKQASEKILFDVGGKRFATTKSTLLKHDNYFSGFLTSGIKPDDKGYYFIDRSPKYFGMVLDYLRDGRLDLDGKSPSQMKLIKEEFDFYLIDLPQFRCELLKLKWASFGSNLQLSDDNKMVTKLNTENNKDCSAIGSIGWSSGEHSFSIEINGVIGYCNTSNESTHWINFGVATQVHKDNLGQNEWYYEGMFLHNSHQVSRAFYSLGVVSGDQIPIPPKSIVNLCLNCDLGTLSFALKDKPPHFTINVPKKEMLYPCVHLYSVGNSVKFV